jgi:hypothetical protein
MSAGAASDPAITTPHESALGGSDATIIIAPKRARISFRSSFVLVCHRCHRERDATTHKSPTAVVKSPSLACQGRPVHENA